MHPENPTITNQYIKCLKIALSSYRGLFHKDSLNLF